MQKWFWARGADRRGPVTLEQIREMIASGQILPADLAWTQGMTAWKPVLQIPELAPPAPAPVPPPAAPRTPKPAAIKPPPAPPANVFVPPAAATKSVAAPISVPKPQPPAAKPKTSAPKPDSPSEAVDESEETVLSARAEQNLVGHARPTGDASAGPLGDFPFEQVQTTLELRKRIYCAAQLYFWLLVLTLVSILTLGIAVAARHFSYISRPSGEPVILLFVLGFMLAVGAVCWVAYRYTLRTHRWAPLVFMVLCLLAVALNIFFGVVRLGQTYNTGGASDDLVATGALSFFGIFFAGISWRAYAAIPKYLDQPAWCQEIIAAARL